MCMYVSAFFIYNKLINVLVSLIQKFGEIFNVFCLFCMQVLSVTLTRLIVSPLELVGSGIGRLFRAALSEIPLHWQPVIMFTIILTTVLMMIMSCNYRLKLPFFLCLEPKTPLSERLLQCKSVRSNDAQRCIRDSPPGCSTCNVRVNNDVFKTSHMRQSQRCIKDSPPGCSTCNRRVDNVFKTPHMRQSQRRTRIAHDRISKLSVHS